MKKTPTTGQKDPLLEKVQNLLCPSKVEQLMQTDKHWERIAEEVACAVRWALENPEIIELTDETRRSVIAVVAGNIEQDEFVNLRFGSILNRKNPFSCPLDLLFRPSLRNILAYIGEGEISINGLICKKGRDISLSLLELQQMGYVARLSDDEITLTEKGRSVCMP